METQTREVTRIRLNKRYLKIITSYLEKKQYDFSVFDPETGKRSVIQIENLTPEDAFYLGVNAQVQLADGEILI